MDKTLLLAFFMITTSCDNVHAVGEACVGMHCCTPPESDRCQKYFDGLRGSDSLEYDGEDGEEEPSGCPDGHDGVDEASYGPPECILDADCPETLVCNDNRCEPNP